MKSDWYRFGIIFVVGLLLLSACNTSQATTAQPTAARTRSASQTRTSGGSTSAVQATRVRPTTAAPTATETPVPATATPVVPSATATPPTQPTPTIGSEGKMAIPDQRQSIKFAAGSSSAAVTLYLADQTPAAYQFDGTTGQNLYLTVAGTANVQIFSPSMAALTPSLVMPGMVTVQLPENGTYTLVLVGLRNITFNVYLTPANSNPASGAPLADKMLTATIPAKPYSVYLDTRLDPAAPTGYTFDAQAGQKLSLTLTGNVAPVVIAPDGNTMVPEPDLFSGIWDFSLVETGQYSLVLAGNGVVAVRAQLTAPSTATLPTLQPNSGIRIAIPESDTSIDLSTSFITDKSQTFVLNAPANHQMIITVTGNAGVVQVTGPDQKPVDLIHSQIVPTWSLSLDQAGDYTIVVAGNGPSQLTFSIPAAGIILP
jgi:hypothetical protein